MFRQLLTTFAALTLGFTAMAQQSDSIPARKSLPSFPKKKVDTTQVVTAPQKIKQPEKLPPAIASDLHFTRTKNDNVHFAAAVEDSSYVLFLNFVPAGSGMQPDNLREIEILRNQADTSVDADGNEVINTFDKLIVKDFASTQDLIVNVAPGVLKLKSTANGATPYAVIYPMLKTELEKEYNGVDEDRPVETGDQISVPTHVTPAAKLKAAKNNMAPQPKKKLGPNASFSERIRNNSIYNN